MKSTKPTSRDFTFAITWIGQIIRPIYTERKRLRFSVYFNVESVCVSIIFVNGWRNQRSMYSCGKIWLKCSICIVNLSYLYKWGCHHKHLVFSGVSVGRYFMGVLARSGDAAPRFGVVGVRRFPVGGVDGIMYFHGRHLDEFTPCAAMLPWWSGFHGSLHVSGSIGGAVVKAHVWQWWAGGRGGCRGDGVLVLQASPPALRLRGRVAGGDDAGGGDGARVALPLPAALTPPPHSRRTPSLLLSAMPPSPRARTLRGEPQSVPPEDLITAPREGCSRRVHQTAWPRTSALSSSPYRSQNKYSVTRVTDKYKGTFTPGFVMARSHQIKIATDWLPSSFWLENVCEWHTIPM